MGPEEAAQGILCVSTIDLLPLGECTRENQTTDQAAEDGEEASTLMPESMCEWQSMDMWGLSKEAGGTYISSISSTRAVTHSLAGIGGPPPVPPRLTKPVVTVGFFRKMVEGEGVEKEGGAEAALVLVE